MVQSQDEEDLSIIRSTVMSACAPLPAYALRSISSRQRRSSCTSEATLTSPKPSTDASSVLATAQQPSAPPSQVAQTASLPSADPPATPSPTPPRPRHGALAWVSWPPALCHNGSQALHISKHLCVCIITNRCPHICRQCLIHVQQH